MLDAADLNDAYGSGSMDTELMIPPGSDNSSYPSPLQDNLPKGYATTTDETAVRMGADTFKAENNNISNPSADPPSQPPSQPSNQIPQEVLQKQFEQEKKIQFLVNELKRRKMQQQQLNLPSNVVPLANSSSPDTYWDRLFGKKKDMMRFLQSSLIFYLLLAFTLLYTIIFKTTLTTMILHPNANYFSVFYTPPLFYL